MLLRFWQNMRCIQLILSLFHHAACIGFFWCFTSRQNYPSHSVQLDQFISVSSLCFKLIIVNTLSWSPSSWCHHGHQRRPVPQGLLVRYLMDWQCASYKSFVEIHWICLFVFCCNLQQSSSDTFSPQKLSKFHKAVRGVYQTFANCELAVLCCCCCYCYCCCCCSYCCCCCGVLCWELKCSVRMFLDKFLWPWTSTCLTLDPGIAPAWPWTQSLAEVFNSRDMAWTWSFSPRSVFGSRCMLGCCLLFTFSEEAMPLNSVFLSNTLFQLNSKRLSQRP